MIDVVTEGFGALQTLREADFKMAIHAHRAMHAAFTRNPKHGISMMVLADIVRLIGCDSLHIGTVVGKLEGSLEEVSQLLHTVLSVQRFKSSTDWGECPVS